MNFCDACLGPKITSNKPGGDDREVHNLISLDANTRKKGFMGEYFISPPIDINVEFSVPIDISHIKLGARLDHMSSTGFTIYTKLERDNSSIVSSISQDIPTSSSVPTSTFPTYNNSSVSAASFTSTSAQYGPSASNLRQDTHGLPCVVSNQEKESEDVHFCVGKFFTKGEDEVILKNHHYKHWIRTPLPDKNEAQTSNTFKGAIRHANREAIRCVTHLMVRIMRTLVKGPPVLGLIEVWGQPGISTSKADKKALLQKWMARKVSQTSKLSIPRLYNSEPQEGKTIETSANPSSVKDKFEVPEDFLDPLTCDIMTVPLLLPSGHSIDAQTLERYICNEGTWGRAASDPFTGVPFRASRQPTPNVPLKARIDRFLLLNGDHPDLENCGRTVGSALATVISINNNFSGSSKRDREDNTLEYPLHSSEKQHTENTVVAEEKDLFSREENSTDEDSDSLDAEIEAALKGKPKYVPVLANPKSLTKIPKAVVCDKKILKNTSSLSKSCERRVRARTLNNQYNPTERAKDKRTSGGGHGFVHMIGGALSVTQGRAAKNVPAHQSNARPSSLICGDQPPKTFQLAAQDSASCLCGAKEGLYSFPCDHLSCRNCLLLQQREYLDVECAICKRVCKRSLILKYHSKSIFSY